MHKRTAQELLGYIAETVVQEDGPLDTPCEVWVKGLRTGGYGNVKFEGVDRPVHRIRWILTFGELPPDVHLDHLCRRHACCNLDHLDPVSCRDNILRGEGIATKQLSRTHCPQGHPYDEVNTYRIPSRPTARYCRACQRDHARRYRARLKGSSTS